MATIETSACACDLDPGIRQTVDYLNRCGWKTTDSGDGVSKPHDEQAIHEPHVVIQLSSPDNMHHEARQVMIALGLEHAKPQDGFTIEASYSPFDKFAVILVCGYDDSDLEEFAGRLRAAL